MSAPLEGPTPCEPQPEPQPRPYAGQVSDDAAPPRDVESRDGSSSDGGTATAVIAGAPAAFGIAGPKDCGSPQSGAPAAAAAWQPLGRAGGGMSITLQVGRRARASASAAQGRACGSPRACVRTQGLGPAACACRAAAHSKASSYCAQLALPASQHTGPHRPHTPFARARAPPPLVARPLAGPHLRRRPAAPACDNPE